MVYDEPKKNIIMLVPYPAQGHVTPMLKLASYLSTFGLQPLIVLPEFIHRWINSKVNAATKGGILCVSIPDEFDETIPRDFFAIEKVMEDHMPPHLNRLICKINGDHQNNIACMVVDLLASWAIDVGNKYGLPVAGFWPAMLASYNLISSFRQLIQRGFISDSGLPQLQGPISFQQGQPLVHVEDLPWLIGSQDTKKARFMFWARTMDRSRSLRWLLVNSFPNESQNLCASYQDYSPNIYPIGPLISNGLNDQSPTFWEEDGSCLDWLEQQRPNSVVYISFGSWVGPIGEAKVRSLALALEELKRPFIWVLGHAWRDGLPKGHIERVGKLGKIVTWAPQVEILQHKAVGCYLTHCGWNSTMEAIQCKKCLLCVPVAGDQSLNCEYIVNVWKIGVKMNGFSIQDVNDGVSRVMEDREMKTRIEKLNVRINGDETKLKVKDNMLHFVNDLKRRGYNALHTNV